MGRKEDNIKKATEIMATPERIRNIGTAAHIDHGKTTLSDNLIAGAGMISEELAGKQLLLDYDEQEQARGITINAAAASMVHTFDGTDYLINLIDTPGHVDFGGDVTRAMRALDGAIIVLCAVEGPMPQTETVIRQALRERVRPVLFINKVDRLINELKLTPEEMQQRLFKWITGVNQLISKFAPEELRDKWMVSPQNGTVAFGSAFHKWAISVPYMQKTGMTFKDIYEYCRAENQKELAKKAPLHHVLLNMSIRHHPNPLEAQKYRIPQIWKGDLNTTIGQSMLKVDPKGPLAMMITKIIVDPHAGEVALGRIYSGSVKRGDEVAIVGQAKKNRIQQVALMVGADRIPIDDVSAGNIAAVSGLRDAIAGSTISTAEDMVSFEKMVHVSDPVVTVAVEAKHVKDLPKLVEVLRLINKADPSIVVQINQETGEHLMSGMGELHLEITEYRIKNEHKVEITTSEPIVVYRESVVGKSPDAFEGKSPNKHNRFYIEAEPLNEATVEALRLGDIHEGKIRRQDQKETWAKLEALGWEKDEAKRIVCAKGTAILVDGTKAIQYLHETMELIMDAFNEVCDRGALTNEPIMGVKFRLVDAKLHEDAVHRGPAQTIPAARSSMYGAMLTANTTLLEPVQRVYVNVPQDLMGDVTRELQSRRGTIEDIESEGEVAVVHALAPVKEMFGFAAAIRSATGGRALWSTEHAGYRPVPRDLVPGVIGEIRQRKGLKPEPPTPEYYAG